LELLIYSAFTLICAETLATKSSAIKVIIFFHYNKDLSITEAKVQKKELLEEKELFFYTKSGNC